MASINDFVDKEQSEQPELQQVDPQELEQPERGGIDLSILKAKTGDGSIESYVEHPMNFNGSKSLAQVIRGMTGLFGSLDYALVDIGLGVMRMMQDRKKAVQHGASA